MKKVKSKGNICNSNQQRMMSERIKKVSDTTMKYCCIKLDSKNISNSSRIKSQQENKYFNRYSKLFNNIQKAQVI